MYESRNETPRGILNLRIACRTAAVLLVLAAAGGPLSRLLGQLAMSDGGFALSVLAFAGGAVLYQAPGLVAWVRGSRQETAVWLVTWCTGWTLVGWLVALWMALRVLPARDPLATGERTEASGT